jgi:hypothetical protein
MRGDPLNGSSIRIDDADLEIAGDIHGQRDPATIRTPRRLEVVVGTSGQRDGLASVGGHLPDVAAHRERDPATVRTPRRIERTGRHGREHVPLFAVGVAIAIRAGDRDGDTREQGEHDQPRDDAPCRFIDA